MSDRFASIVLASASPRRHEILTQMGVRFRVAEHTVDERMQPGEPPVAFVQRLALEKARSVQALQPHNPLPVMGADTIVVCGQQILGKPLDREDALRMLALLSGRRHQVHTAVALCLGARQEVVLSTTEVGFRPLSAAQMQRYWESGEPEGKAGAYAIQGLGGMFVNALNGSYSGVVGLPVFETGELCTRFGVQTGLSVEEQA
ncbi:MAG: septum formation inhibitor Maf [Pseudomonadales bacterium]|nr:septum formation inhibitor Maf [Pseudomonadales bacterium]MCP5330571.1 septum formation inhibitor Maf [Pseudomonadales bacterium]MCP5344198.1 septum formation inhibitor Maf [Pseudomonadales bacterium]